VALLNPEVVHTGQAAGPAGWSYRVLYPSVEVVIAVAAELGWPRGTPSFPETVVDDERSALLLLSAHSAAERGDLLASSSLLAAALAGLLRALHDCGVSRLVRSRAPIFGQDPLLEQQETTEDLRRIIIYTF
jgi:hypothetical protein